MKKSVIKILGLCSCFAILVSVASLFSSCHKNASGTKNKNLEHEKEEKKTVVIENGVSYYTVIRAQNTDQITADNAKRLRDSMAQACDCAVIYALDLPKSEDQMNESAKEILVGNTDRIETQEVLASLEPNTWAVVNNGDKIVICANNNALLTVAVDWFIENCINAQEKTVKITEDLVKNEGFGDDLPVVVGNYSDYQVVYPKGDENLEYYASLFKRRAGIQNIVSDDKEESDYEIVIGYTNRTDLDVFDDNEYSIKTKGTKVYINAASAHVLYYAINYYIEYTMSIGETVVSVPSNYNVDATLNDYFKSNWKLALPYIQEGAVSKVFNAGTGLADDREADTPSDSYMHVVSKVEYSSYEKYAKRLESFGFKKIYESKIEETDLWGYRLGGAYAYIHYTPSQKCMRVIWDKSSISEVSEIDSPVEQTGETVFYQYSLDYIASAMNLSGTGRNCGMLYAIKLQDNSLIMIDSGSPYQSNDIPLQAICDFLYDITGTDENEALHIRFWYFTHPDSDHTGLAYHLLEYMKKHGYKAPDIEAVGFNFPNIRSNDKLERDKVSYNMVEHMATNYPNIKYIKLHTGMVFNIAEVKFEILGTLENIVSAQGTIEANWDTNDTCSFARLFIGGKSIMLCGDICNDTNSQKYHYELYSKEYFKSDVLQVSHHGLNLLTTIYDACAPEYAFISNAYENIVKKSAHINYYNKMVSSDKLFFAGDYTTKMTISNGEIKVTKILRYDQTTVGNR